MLCYKIFLDLSSRRLEGRCLSCTAWTLRSGRPRSFSIANLLSQDSCKDRYTSPGWDSVLVEAVCECGDLECPGRSCREWSNHACSHKNCMFSLVCEGRWHKHQCFRFPVDFWSWKCTFQRFRSVRRWWIRRTFVLSLVGHVYRLDCRILEAVKNL